MQIFENYINCNIAKNYEFYIWINNLQKIIIDIYQELNIKNVPQIILFDKVETALENHKNNKENDFIYLIFGSFFTVNAALNFFDK